MPDFHDFATKIHARYMSLARNELYLVGGASDGLFDVFAHYLKSFPEGSNPIYKTRTYHDCSCCRQFVRNLGRVVAISDGKIETIWNVPGLESPYKEVAESMDGLLRELSVNSVWRTKEPQYGNEVTRQLLDDGTVKRWNHFHGKVQPRHFNKDPEKARGQINESASMLRRALNELKPEALATVLELIDQKDARGVSALYRGEEHRAAVVGFNGVQTKFLSLKSKAEREVFIWTHAGNMAVSRFRNTVIGTLVVDLSEGVNLESAVKSFEAKVAPTNYKRTTALITPRMVQDAMTTIKELGLEPSLYRRLANMSDISINNVLWADRSDQPLMKGGIQDILMGAAQSPAPPKEGVVDIGIDEFMKSVLPTAQSIDIRVLNEHLPNFVTVTAPQNPNTGKLFKWSNDFAWSYNGNITDSIREKVKKAGGNIEADLRFSLAWFNGDDLDIHMHLPNGDHIYFGNPGMQQNRGRSSRVLDVDMNAGYASSRTPVENLALMNPEDGNYRVFVHQYLRRETVDVGFTVEVACGNDIKQYSYRKGVVGQVDVGTFVLRNGLIVESKINPELIGSGLPQHKWGIKTEGNVRVRTIMYSPNFWDDNKVGNKHWFFILEGAKVDETMRGIYNEFLSSGLEKHRKVFEVLGDKTRCPPTDEQLTGLGFSSTRDSRVTVTVKSDRGQRVYNVNI